MTKWVVCQCLTKRNYLFQAAGRLTSRFKEPNNDCCYEIGCDQLCLVSKSDTMHLFLRFSNVTLEYFLLCFWERTMNDKRSLVRKTLVILSVWTNVWCCLKVFLNLLMWIYALQLTAGGNSFCGLWLDRNSFVVLTLWTLLVPTWPL